MTDTAKPHGYMTRTIHWLAAGLVGRGDAAALDLVRRSRHTAREQGAEGDCLIHFTVDVTGAVSEAHVEGCPAVFEALESGRALAIDDAARDLRVAQVARDRYRLASVLYQPVRIGSAPVMVEAAKAASATGGVIADATAK